MNSLEIKETLTRRFYKRLNIELPVTYSTESTPSKRFLGTFTDLSSEGACLRTSHELNLDESITLWSFPDAPVGLHFLSAKVVRSSPVESGSKDGIHSELLYGVKFIDKKSHTYAIKLLMDRQQKLRNQSRFSFVKVTLLLSLCFTLPGSAIYFFLHSSIKGKLVFILFLAFITIERLWETYYTGRHSGKLESFGDWTLSTVTFYYVVVLQMMVIEFFVLQKREYSWVALTAGIISLLCSFILRAWSVKTLGDQWAIHLSDISGKKDKMLVASGPYRFVRHPIYVAYFLELAGITLATNCYFTLLFALLVNVPIQFIRTHIEERGLLSSLGDAYARYMSTTPAFFPRLTFQNKIDKEGRVVQKHIDFPDRRSGRRR